MSYNSSHQKLMPIFKYPGGTQVRVDNIPSNAVYKWIDGVGGQGLPGPIPYGTLRPDGRPAHGGVMTYNTTGTPVIEYHESHY